MRRFTINRVTFQDNNLMMASYIDSWGEDDTVLSGIESGTYKESQTMNWWLAMCRVATAGNITLDLGSYTGLYSLVASVARPDIRTIAFEPSAMTYGRLSYNILLNHADMRILPVHCAISDIVGTLDLAHAYGVYTMASGESVKASFETDFSETVPATSLDRIFCLSGEPKIGTIASKSWGLNLSEPIHAMKIDTEGAEETVLVGATGVIAKFSPYIIVEIFDEDVLSRIGKLLSDLGYKQVASCDGCNYIFSHLGKVDALTEQYNQLNDCDVGKFAIKRLVDIGVTELLDSK